MSEAARKAPTPKTCVFGAKCSNPRCRMAHPVSSPSKAALMGSIPIKVCWFGSECQGKHCNYQHPILTNDDEFDDDVHRVKTVASESQATMTSLDKVVSQQSTKSSKTRENVKKHQITKKNGGHRQDTVKTETRAVRIAKNFEGARMKRPSKISKSLEKADFVTQENHVTLQKNGMKDKADMGRRNECTDAQCSDSLMEPSSSVVVEEQMQKKKFPKEKELSRRTEKYNANASAGQTNQPKAIKLEIKQPKMHDSAEPQIFNESTKNQQNKEVASALEGKQFSRKYQLQKDSEFAHNLQATGKDEKCSGSNNRTSTAGKSTHHQKDEAHTFKHQDDEVSENPSIKSSILNSRQKCTGAGVSNEKVLCEQHSKKRIGKKGKRRNFNDKASQQSVISEHEGLGLEINRQSQRKNSVKEVQQDSIFLDRNTMGTDHDDVITSAVADEARKEQTMSGQCEEPPLPHKHNDEDEKKRKKNKRMELLAKKHEEQFEKRSKFWEEFVQDETCTVNVIIHLLAAEYCRIHSMAEKHHLIEDHEAFELLRKSAHDTYRCIYSGCIPSRVTVRGTLEHQLNGRTGKISHWDESKDQYSVIMDTRKGKQTEIRHFSPGNLEEVTPLSAKKKGKDAVDIFYFVSIGSLFCGRGLSMDVYKSDVDRLKSASSLEISIFCLMEERRAGQIKKEEHNHHQRGENEESNHHHKHGETEKTSYNHRRGGSYRDSFFYHDPRNCGCPECFFQRILFPHLFLFGGSGRSHPYFERGYYPFHFGFDANDFFDDDSDEDWDWNNKRGYAEPKNSSDDDARAILGVTEEATAAEIKRGMIFLSRSYRILTPLSLADIFNHIFSVLQESAQVSS